MESARKRRWIGRGDGEKGSGTTREREGKGKVRREGREQECKGRTIARSEGENGTEL